MKNILIVDDEKFIRLGLRTLITRSKLCTGEILEAKNGAEAVELLRTTEFDLIFSDIKMPILDGLELMKTIQQESLSQANLVIISGYDDFSFAVEAMRSGACEYLLKPVEREAVQGVLERREAQLEEESLQGLKSIDLPTDKDAPQDKLQKIQSAVEFIQNHYHEDINMAVVSNEVSMNYTFFSETFKESTGKSFVEYLKFVRISMAKKLLRSSSIPISQVAFQVGFKDDKHFSKTFKLETGQTPSEYKKQHQAVGN